MEIIIAGFGLFLAIFVFNIIASFTIGKILLFIAAIAISYMIATIIRDSEKATLTKLLISASISAGLFMAAYARATSTSACDGYYLSRFSSQQPYGGTPQSSITITYSKASEICQFSGFNDACKSYRECQERWLGGSFLTLLIIFGIMAFGITIGYWPRRSGIKQNSDQDALEHESIEAVDHSIGRKSNRTNSPTDDAPECGQKSPFPTVLAPYRDSISQMTLYELSEATNRSEMSLRATLSRHGISCKNYDGVAVKKMDELRAQQNAESNKRDKP